MPDAGHPIAPMTASTLPTPVIAPTRAATAIIPVPRRIRAPRRSSLVVGIAALLRYAPPLPGGHHKPSIWKRRTRGGVPPLDRRVTSLFVRDVHPMLISCDEVVELHLRLRAF